jgi:hypothetical protein
LPQKPGVRAKQSAGGIEVVVVLEVVLEVEVVELVVLLVVVELEVVVLVLVVELVVELVEVEVELLVVLEVLVVELVVVVVLVLVDVVVVVATTATAIVLSIVNGLLKPSSSSPCPVIAAVAPPTMFGIVQGNGPKIATTSFAGMSTLVTRFVQSGSGGTAGAPVGPGQQKSAVTSRTLQPI